VAFLYVSDVLEGVLDCRDIRTLVRNQCSRVLDGLHADIASNLAVPLHYVAGKCMGYPAVWLSSVALGLTIEQTRQRLAAFPGPLYVSLTTSIADDFLDGDENVRPAHMMVLYMLLFSALREQTWFAGDIDRLYREKVYPLIAGFVAEQPLWRTDPAGPDVHEVAKAGRRIGAFFETIALGMARDEPPARRAALVALAGAFGDWCSDLDDIVDIEIDIRQGDTLTYPIFALMQAGEAPRAAVLARDAAACENVITDPGFISGLAERQAGKLRTIADRAEECGFDLLARSLERSASILPDRIVALRAQVAGDARRGREILAGAAG